MKKYHRKCKILLALACLTCFLLTACGGTTRNITESSVTAVQTKTAESPALSVPEQIDVILSHKDTWLKEDVRMVGEGDPDTSYAEGPHYSLMDLDQDGYIELIVTNEKNQSCPAFYEVTGDKSLKQWTAEGDLPQAENISTFDLTSKVGCFYDPSRDEYHYIVMDYLSLCQDEADASFLEMTPVNDRIIFKKIGRYTFDAFKDNTHHYFNNSGKECKENELYHTYADMVKKTIYYKKIPISIKKGKELTADTLTDKLWSHFFIRDNYRCEKENDLTEDIAHQFFSLSISREYCTRDAWSYTDEIRYTAADLDNDQNIELIVENQTKKDYGIYEYDEEDDEGNWNTEGKDLASFTERANNIAWQTDTLEKFMELDDEFLEDILLECWLKFS